MHLGNLCTLSKYSSAISGYFDTKPKLLNEKSVEFSQSSGWHQTCRPAFDDVEDKTAKLEADSSTYHRMFQLYENNSVWEKDWPKQLLNKYMWKKNLSLSFSRILRHLRIKTYNQDCVWRLHLFPFLLRIWITVELNLKMESSWHLSFSLSLFPPLGGADRQQCLWLCPPWGPRGDGRAAGHEASAWAGSPLTGHHWGRSQLSIFLLPVGDPWARWELQS